MRRGSEAEDLPPLEKRLEKHKARTSTFAEGGAKKDRADRLLACLLAWLLAASIVCAGSIASRATVCSRLDL